MASVANELRLVQVDLADRDEQQRRPYLQEVLKRALADVPAEEHRAFLSELIARFPSWDGRSDDAGLPARAPQVVKDTFDERTPAELVARLAELAKKSPDERAAIQNALRGAELLPAAAKGGWPREAEASLRDTLQIEDQQSVDPARALELLAQLMDYVVDWDRVVWNTWRQIAPDARLRRPQALQRSVRAYLTGDPGVPKGQVTRDIGTLKQLISSLVSAIGVAGNTFAADYLKELSPGQIEDFVKGGEEKLPYIGDRGKTACWNKYVQLAAGMEDRAAKGINQAVANFVEGVMRGAMLNPAAASSAAVREQTGDAEGSST